VRPVGEVNPYFGFPEAAERIAAHIPQCKIICTFRNPVERIYSAYKLWRHYTLTPRPARPIPRKVPQIIEVTRYAKHLPDWRARFGADRVLVLLNDDLRDDPQAYLDRVCDFIGIARYPVPAGAAGELINSINDLPRFPRFARKARHFMHWLEEKQAYSITNFLERAGVWRFSFGGGPKFPLSGSSDRSAPSRFDASGNRRARADARSRPSRCGKSCAPKAARQPSRPSRRAQVEQPPMARVSVILPVFNGASTVGRALASVFAQTFTDYEIVAVNDGSTDDTASVLSGYGDRIRVVTQSNRGLSAARNAGIHASQSDYVAFIDDDDEWMPEKLARCVPHPR